VKWRKIKRCGTVMIYCCSGSDFGKVLGSGSASGSRQNLAKILKGKNFTQSCHFNDRISVVSQKNCLSFKFFTFVFHLMLNLDLNPVPEYSQKVAGPAVPVPQYRKNI
jgi:hypothetical protein